MVFANLGVGRFIRRAGLVLPGILAAGLAGGLAGPGTGVARAQLLVEPPDIDFNGETTVRVPASRPDRYYLLRSGGTIDAIDEAVDLQPGSGGELALHARRLPFPDTAFFQAVEVPLAAPLDTDGDGMDDAWELRHAPALDPLDAHDGAGDPDDDGFDNLAEYRLHLDPRSADLTRIRASSPRNNESGVAVTRETVVRFSRPLAEGTVLGPGNFFAETAGRRWLTRVELSGDRRQATLFYLEPLPSSAQVQVTLLGAGLRDGRDQLLDLDADARPGGDARIVFRTCGTTGLPGTGVEGVVYASELRVGGPGSVNVPLAGVTITVDGAEESLRATTDADGRFLLSPCPAGRFFVHVDGRTAAGSQWPGGAYYPVVGKAWEAVAGSLTNRAGGTGQIYLPLIRADTLREVGAAEATRVGFPVSVLAAFPEFDGVALTVPPNALYSENGARGGRVGLAPVPPDRLPEPLPPGLDPPLVITIQTDGPQNFDRPVPVRFPNLPDPVSGERLSPGARTGLWSFNHDTGRWEMQGSMTVSADGRWAESDPGVGVLQPGWHTDFPGSQWEDDDDDSDPREQREDLPCDEPPPGLDIWPLYVEWNECAQNLLSVKDAVRIGEEIGQFMIGAIEAGERLGSPTNTAPLRDRVIAYYYDVFGLNVELGGIAYDAVKFGVLKKMVTLVPDLLTCVTGMSKEMNAVLCGIVCADDPFCRFGKDMSENVDFLANLVKPAAKQLIKGVTNPRGLAFDKIRPNLLALATALGLPGFAPPALAGRSGSPALGSPAVTDDELLALVAGIDEEARDGLAALNLALPGVREMIDFVEPRETAIRRGLTEMMWNSRETHWAGARWELERSDGRKNRGTISSLGAPDFPVLAADTKYSLRILHLQREAYAELNFRSAPAGSPTRFGTPPITALQPVGRADTDGDGVPDDAEEILGTDPRSVDSDADGVPDGAELRGDTDVLGPPSAFMGEVGGTDTPGAALDLAVEGDLAVVADDTEGIAVFALPRDDAPVRLAQFDTPGRAQAVALEGATAVVADGSAGVAILDLRDPTSPALVREIPLEGGLGVATDVALRDGVIYAAAGARGLHVLEAATGATLAVLGGVGNVGAVTVDRDVLFLLTDTELRLYRSAVLGLDPLGAVAVLGPVPAGETGRKLAVCGSLAFVGTGTGYRVIDVGNPAAPVSVSSLAGNDVAVRSLAHDGTRTLAVAAQFGAVPGAAVGLFDLANPALPDNRVAVVDGPGVERAVAWHRGRLLSASGADGLRVFQPLPPDLALVPPTLSAVTLVDDEDPAAPGIQAPAGRRIRPRFSITDDRQVARVELVLNGRVAAVATGCPFDVAALLEPAAPGGLAATVRLRAIDIGGNSTETPELTVELTTGPTGPRLVRSEPVEGGTVAAPAALRLIFAEAVEDVAGATLVDVGADGVVGGGDDTVHPLAASDLRLGAREWRVTPAGVLPAGAYALVSPSVSLRFAVLNPPVTLHHRGGPWNVAANWEEGRVPGPDDYVQAASVEIGEGEQVVVSGLQASGDLRILGGSLTLTGASASAVGGKLILFDPERGRGTLEVRRGVLHLPGTTALGIGRLLALEGGRVYAPAAVRWTCENQRTGAEFAAEGFGSEIQLPALAEMQGPLVIDPIDASHWFELRAELGGRLSAPKLGPAVTGKTRLQATRNGVLRLPAVQRIFTDLLGGGIGVSFLEVGSGGEIEIGPLTSARGLQVLRGQGARFEVDRVVEARDAQFKIASGTAVFARLESAESLSVEAAGSQVWLPVLTRHVGPGEWKAGGTGGYLGVTALASLTGPTVGVLALSASANGLLDLPLLTEADGGVSFLASGDRRASDSRVSAPRLARLHGNQTGQITRDGFSTLELPALAEIRGVELLYQRGVPLDLPRVTELAGGSLTADVLATPDVSQFLRLTDVSLRARQSAVLEIPATTALVLDGSAARQVTWETGQGGLVRLAPGIAGIAGGGTGGVTLILRAGYDGRIDAAALPALPAQPAVDWSIESPLGLGVIDLSGLSTIPGHGRIRLAEGTEAFGQTWPGGTLRLHPVRVAIPSCDLELRPRSVITAGIIESDSAVITGRGELEASLVSGGGRIAPGFAAPPEERFGLIRILGDLTLSGTAALEVHLETDALAGVTFDQLLVTGQASLGGSLRYDVPASASGTFPVLTAAMAAGNFGVVTKLTPESKDAVVVYPPGGAGLFVTP